MCGDAFEWFKADVCDPDPHGWSGRLRTPGLDVIVPLKASQATVQVNGTTVQLSHPLLLRKKEFYAPLRWVADVSMASPDTARVPDAIVIADAAGTRLVPLSALPDKRIGLCCWCESMSHIGSPGSDAILPRLRAVLRRKLASQGIEAVDVDSLRASAGSGLRVTLTAVPTEGWGADYSGGRIGTSVKLDFVIREEERGNSDGYLWADQITQGCSDVITASEGESMSAAARRDRTSSLFSLLGDWQFPQSANTVWWHKYGPAILSGKGRRGCYVFLSRGYDDSPSDRTTSTDTVFDAPAGLCPVACRVRHVFPRGGLQESEDAVEVALAPMRNAAIGRSAATCVVKSTTRDRLPPDTRKFPSLGR